MSYEESNHKENWRIFDYKWKQAGAELSQAQQKLGSCTILLFYAVVMYGDEAVSKKCFEVYSQPLTTWKYFSMMGRSGRYLLRFPKNSLFSKKLLNLKKTLIKPIKPSYGLGGVRQNEIWFWGSTSYKNKSNFGP